MDCEVKNYKTKLIQFCGRTTLIILQNDNESCPLLAICNVLLLKNKLELSPDIIEISQKRLLELVAEQLENSNSNVHEKEQQQNIDDAIRVLPKLATGINVNLQFKRITEIQVTSVCAPFHLLDIPLYHGWIVDPQDNGTYNAIGSKSYDSIMLDNAGSKDSDDFVAATLGVPSPGELELINAFVDTNSSQLTVYGLSCLQEELKEQELCVLYRNNHFNTMFKIGGQLYLLLTDEGFLNQPDLVWEMLNEVKGTTFVNGSFKSKGLKMIEKEKKYIQRLITSVKDDDEEFKKFSITIPSLDVMAKENFSLPQYSSPTMRWCDKNLTRSSGFIKDVAEKGHEMHNAWNNLVLERLDGEETKFSVFSELRKKEFLDSMLDDIRRSKAALNYRKYKFALLKESRRSFKKPISSINDTAHDNSVSNSDMSMAKALQEQKLEQQQPIVSGALVTGPQEHIASTNDAAHDNFVSNSDITSARATQKHKCEQQPRPARILKTQISTGYSFIFPQFPEIDVVRQYTKPFTLDSWFKAHKHIHSRWLPTVPNVCGLKVQHWNGDRPKRECLYIMQSILSAVQDYHQRTDRRLGNLHDHSSIFLSQCTHGFLGFQQVRFEITFPEPMELEPHESIVEAMAKDMQEVKRIFIKILDGKDLTYELLFLLSLLDRYPFSGNPWKNQLLQNFTGLWDGRSRACFIVLFYTLECDMNYKTRNRFYGAMKSCKLLKCPSFHETWLDRIPEDDSLFYKILTLTHSTNLETVDPEAENETVDPEAENETVDPEAEKPPPQPQYEEFSTDAVVKYCRACLHHNKDARGNMDISHIEVGLTNLFPGLVFSAYFAMCLRKSFLG